MAILPIIKIGHPTLRKKAQKITEIDGEIHALAQDMIQTMQLNEGVGLAGNQVNDLRRIFVIDLSLIDEKLKPKAFINPEILATEGSEPYEEGCLSIPDVRAEVVRPEKITARYQTLTGETIEEKMDGLTARVYQHELDHLNGILFIDHLPPLERKFLEPKIRKIREANSII